MDSYYLCTYIMYCILCSCISLYQLDPELLSLSQCVYSFSISAIIFKYTSKSNFVNMIEPLKLAVKYSKSSYPYISRCQFYAAFFGYNYIFISCNLMTGTPRPLCRNSCYIFKDQCEFEYTIISTYANWYGVPLSEDCENVFHHINKLYNYPNTSKDFENDCLDFPGT